MTFARALIEATKYGVKSSAPLREVLEPAYQKFPQHRTNLVVAAMMALTNGKHPSLEMLLPMSN